MQSKTCQLFLLTTAWLFFTPIFSASNSSAETLRIVSYNLEDKPTTAAHDADIREIIAEIGNHPVHGVARSIDLMGFQEGPGGTGSYNFLESDFETVFGGNYEAIYSTASNGCRRGFVYNDDTLDLISSSSIDNMGFTHLPMLATFQPVNGSGDDMFSVITLHLKAGDTGSDQSQRDFETTQVFNIVNSLPAGRPVIMMGDLNMKGSDEDAWSGIVAAGGLETINAPFGVREANWNDSLAYLPYHTQEIADALGGMDDRFDVMMVTGEFFDDRGIEFNPGSFTTLGNNGTHNMNGSIMTGNANSSVHDNLIDISDHLPVFGDFDWNVFRTTPANSMSIEAVANYTVRPGGPGGGSGIFQVEGSSNGSFAAFGVADFDLSIIVSAGIATRVEDSFLELVQDNASFTRDGPVLVYVASTTATAVAINSGIQFQSGNDGLDCVPATLANGASLIATFPGVHHSPSGSDLPDGTLDKISLTSYQIEVAMENALNTDGIVRLILVPGHPSTAATYAGNTNGTYNGPTVGGLYDANNGRRYLPLRDDPASVFRF